MPFWGEMLQECSISYRTPQIEDMDDTGIAHGEWQPKAYGSHVNIHKIKKGMPCRLETQRQIILALGYKISDKDKVFPKE